METGVHITSGLKVYEALRSATRAGDLFVSFEDLPALIAALTALVPTSDPVLIALRRAKGVT